MLLGFAFLWGLCICVFLLSFFKFWLVCFVYLFSKERERVWHWVGGEWEHAGGVGGEETDHDRLHENFLQLKKKEKER